MALFRSRPEPDEPKAAAPEEAGNDAPAPAATAAFDRSSGPFDEAEADLADQELPRLDLGSLLLPGLPGLQVQVEADQNTQEVRAITAVATEAAVQLQAFAAPRSEGLWEELRAEMLAELGATAGAQVSEHVGPFGPELRAVVPARTPDGQQVQQPLRFCGIDGPRWFLRAVFLGRAAVEDEPDELLLTLIRQTLVVRGPDAMAPRDPLPLHLPEQDPGEAADEAREATLDPLERGPEIAEIR